MRMPHEPNAVVHLREPTPDDPWRVLLSGCLAGLPCGVDGTDYGFGGVMDAFFATPLATAYPFCPEDVGLGTPRGWPDIHGGDGMDVLDGGARVLDPDGNDQTQGMITGAEAMTLFARRERVDFAILMDMSGACATQVISDGSRFIEDRAYRMGVGVAAASLLRAGVPVVSQRDFRSLDALRARVDPTHTLNPEALDHHETLWYRKYFGMD
jgi:uncharacterized protein YbbK (DUF523 family)